MIEIGVIPAAGYGCRFAPYIKNKPKTLFEIGDLTLLERNINILTKQMGVKKIYIIHGHLGEQIIKHLSSRNYPNVSIEYIECPDPGTGLAMGLLLLKNIIKEPFITLLGDEFYLDSNHQIIQQLDLDQCNAACGYLPHSKFDLIKQNYSLTITDDEIKTLEEKPQQIANDLLGCGTFVFKPDIFEYIEKTAPSPRSGNVELIDAISLIVKETGKVKAIELHGSYRNINYEKDYIEAIHIYRKQHCKNHKTSLIIPAYNEEVSLPHVIKEFSGKVDEIVIAANSSSNDRTVELAQQSNCKVIVEPFAGYGDALKKGMAAASGNILILVEADGSFSADDLPKLLSYLYDADMVIGTRTNKQFIVQEANMNGMLRWGNLLAAKFIQFCWFSTKNCFTDLGCTYRALWKDCFKVIEPNINAHGPEFSPEMMVEVMRAKRKIIETPVTYRPRIGGESKHSRTWPGILKTATRMLALVIKKRFQKMHIS
jgi:NDP-sugar pyrophosphorylase family protein